ncbi:CPS-53 (KpLE1) prophage protein [Escherichia coli]|nr:CPS-53 (KpLE1) prophage protein [Escherichia coli]
MNLTENSAQQVVNIVRNKLIIYLITEYLYIVRTYYVSELRRKPQLIKSMPLFSAQGVNEIISKIGADAVALPENFRIHDLEKFNLNRFRFRGALSTASIDDFTRYSKDLAR